MTTRAELIAAGVIVPDAPPVTVLRGTSDAQVLRLDDLGRREAARRVARPERYDYRPVGAEWGHR